MPSYNGTKVNILGTVSSFLNRLAITNLIFFVYGASSAGEAFILQAYSAFATLSLSYCELQIAKSQQKLTNRHFFIHLLNTILATSCLIFLGVLDFGYQLLLIFLAWLFMGFNLGLSGFLFARGHFLQYRFINIASEILEVTAAVFFIFVVEPSPVMLVSALILLKTGLVFGVSILYIFIKRLRHQKDPEISISTAEKSTSMTDVIGNLFVVWVVPNTIVFCYGASYLGNYNFAKQFFSLGPLVQKSIFKGLWSDTKNQRVRHVNFFWLILEKSWLLSLVSGACVAIIVSHVVGLDIPKIDFVAISLFAVALHFARQQVLISGHLLGGNVFNGEILFCGLFLSISAIFHFYQFDILFYQVLCASTFLGFILLLSGTHYLNQNRT